MKDLYPFLFQAMQGERTGKSVVLIAHFDMIHYHAAWMADPDVGNYPLVPDVDIVEERHIFDTQEEAIKFIMEWWVKRAMDITSYSERAAAERKV